MKQFAVTILDSGDSPRALEGVCRALEDVTDLRIVRADILAQEHPQPGSDYGVLIIPFDTSEGQRQIATEIAKLRNTDLRIAVLGVGSACNEVGKVPLGSAYDELISLEWISARDKIKRFVQHYKSGRRNYAIEVFLNSSLDGFWYLDLIDDRLEWSERTCQIVGIPRSKAPTNMAEFLALIDPLDLDRVSQAVNNHLYHHSPYRNIEMRLRRSDGSYGNFLANGQAVFDSSGQPVLLAGSLTDRTLLQQVEQQLEDTMRRFTVLFHRMNDAAVLADVETGRIIEANEPAERLWGKSIAELIGSHQSELHPPVLSDTAREAFRKHIEALRQNKRDTIEVPILRKDGAEIPAEISSSLIEIGGKMMILGVFRDISERRRAELEIRERDAQIQLSSHLASLGTLAAGVAHEINNPLTYVIGNLELIRSGIAEDLPQRADLSEALNTALTGARYMREIVADLKSISNADTAGNSCDPLDVLRMATRMAMSDLRHRAKLECDFDPVPRIQLPASRFTQVILNLLSNSARSFNDRDRRENLISIRTRRQDGQVVVTISDNGSGIKPQDLKRVFDPFFTRNQGTGGTGLGLSICRRIMQDAKGELELASEPGQGTTVTLRLPIAPEGPAEPAPSETVLPSHYRDRVMIVDDDALVARLTALFLKDDVSAVVFTNPVEALEALQADPRGWALVLCDLMMPELDGPALYAKAQQIPGGCPEFLFVTGGGVTEHSLAFEQDMRRNGRVLLKPFEASELRSRVRALLGDTTPAPSGNPSQDNEPGPRAAPEPEAPYELEALLGPAALTAQFQKVHDSLQDTRRDIASALAAGAMDQIALAAHKLAGSAAVLGLAAMSDSLKACEHAARDGDADRTRDLLKSLDQWQDRLAALIARRNAETPQG